MSTIKTSNANLLEDAPSSSLSSSATAAASTISVYSIADFAISKTLLIGEFGQEGSEIIATHGSTAPTGTTVTLVSNLVKSHPKDTKVYVLPYNYVQFFRATTTTGTKTQLGSDVAVSSESVETLYTDTTNSTGYAFTRFYDSLGNTYSDYSDPIPYAGLGSNTVGYAINLAMKEMKKQFSDTLTYEILTDEVNACLRYVRGKLKRWSNLQEFNYVLDAATVLNDYIWTLPTTYYDKNSNRSMLQIWLDGHDNLEYKDKQEFDDFDRNSDAGQPLYFTIYDGSVYITPKVGADYITHILYMDYYTDIVEVDSDADELTLARFDMIKHWLKWQIRNITENNAKLDMGDGDFMLFQNILNDAIRRESSGQRFKMMPKINGITYQTETNQNFDIT